MPRRATYLVLIGSEDGEYEELTVTSSSYAGALSLAWWKVQTQYKSGWSVVDLFRV